MAIFVYTGKSSEGRLLHGEVVADSAQSAIAVLRTRQVLITHIDQKCRGMMDWIQSIQDFGMRGVKSRDLLSFTQQLATMLKAGIPLLECLTMLAQHSQCPALRHVLVGVRQDIERGLGLAESFRKYPRVFNEFYVNLVEVGEMTGMLDPLLTRLSSYLERQTSLKGKIFSALAYPATLLGVACLVFLFMLVWVVPLFDQMFTEFGDTLPWLTQVVLDVSVGIQRHFLIIGLSVIVGVLGAIRFYNSTRGRKYFDTFLFRVPFVSRVFRESSVVQFTRTLGILLGSGVPILDGLTIAGKISGNRLVEATMQDVRLRIREGETIAQPLAKSALFPPMVTQMIRVGESTGSLDTMLEQIADFYEQEMDRTISVLTSLLEPVVILLIGLGIGVMVVGMYLPLFTMGSLI